MGLKGISSLSFWGLLDKLGSRGWQARWTRHSRPQLVFWGPLMACIPGFTALAALCFSRVTPRSTCDPWLRFLLELSMNSFLMQPQTQEVMRPPGPGRGLLGLGGPGSLWCRGLSPHFWGGPGKAA